MHNIDFLFKQSGASIAETNFFIFLAICHTNALSKKLLALANEVRLSKTDFFATLLDVERQEIANAINRKFRYADLHFFAWSDFLDDVENGYGINNNFAFDLFNTPLTQQKLLSYHATEMVDGALNKTDFGHLEYELSVASLYLNRSLKKNMMGSNILIHGPSGSGKTEFAKVLANACDASLFNVLNTDIGSNETLDIEQRLKIHQAADQLLQGSRSLLLIDDANDMFMANPVAFFVPDTRMATIEAALQNNTCPTLWVANDISGIDTAVLRQFSVIIEFKPMSTAQRLTIFTNMLRKKIDHDILNALANTNYLDIGLVTKAHQVANTLHPLSIGGYQNVLLYWVNAALKAQHKRCIKTSQDTKTSDTLFDPQLINVDFNVTTIIEKLRQNRHARICCYGMPGTGKSMFARFVAEQLNKPIVIKKASDLLGKYVGESEKNIAKAFTEAKARDAILVIDEIDSFITSRTQLRANWESTLVNEMLVQMENFEGILFGTTNLLERLDPAAVRRFDLKMEFKALTLDQRVQLISRLAAELLPDNEPSTELYQSAAQRLQGLTPSDGGIIQRQVRFNPVVDFADLIARLTHEVTLKAENQRSRPIGFIHN
ncbi:AAA family ATPase [Pseudidiomarina mangrovi]|uniref:AAA family ATPase n=1 Tax=Pseudidiomarina mangrovi TaxID=2487133 RepID=UPI0013E0732F|nr:ATP-binding protein [Pseudidiomarina mangrovi]